jgi:transposase
MLGLPSSVRIYLAAVPVDLRCGFDGLAAATRTIIRQDPLSGHVFCFLNRRRDRAKLLVWSPSGFWLLFKRLERGRFQWPGPPAAGARHIELSAADLALMLEGIDLAGARRRATWSPAKNQAGSD